MNKFFIPIVFLALALFSFDVCFAQYDRNYIEDDGGTLWKSDSFVDFGLGEEHGEVSDLLKSETDYISEEEAAKEDDVHEDSNTADRIISELTRSKNTIPRNIKWGAGTGLILGGWLALGEGRTSRETFRFIGSGVILGSALGFFVATKKAWQPSEAIASSSEPQYDFGLNVNKDYANFSLNVNF